MANSCYIYKSLDSADDRKWVYAHLFRHVPDTDAFRANNGLTYRQLGDALRERCGTCIVSTLQEKIIGYVVVGQGIKAGRRHGEILALHVLEAHRKRGVGTKLLSMAFVWLSDSHVASISVQVSPSNTTAIHLYSAMGLRPATLEMEINTGLAA